MSNDSNRTSTCSNPTKPKGSVFGVGFNDADYNVTRGRRENGKKVFDWICPIYLVWKAMLGRCYSVTSKKHNPSYTCEKVCDDWLYFSKFRAWVVTQDWEGKALDKDLLAGDSPIYGPNTCVFIPQWLNVAIADRSQYNGECLPGVYWYAKTKKYNTSVSLGMGRGVRQLGYFEDQVEAHKVWRDAKAGVFREMIALQTDQRIIAALEKKIVDLYQHLVENSPTQTNTG